MTTNLYETLDKAVESRIHIHIPFKSLPYEYRAQIWTHFLDPTPQTKKNVNEDDIGELALWIINGRQIKNAFRMSLAYCRQEEDILAPQILNDMVRLTCPHAEKESFEAPDPVRSEISDKATMPLPTVPRESGSCLLETLPLRSSDTVQEDDSSNILSKQMVTQIFNTAEQRENSPCDTILAETSLLASPDNLSPSYSEQVKLQESQSLCLHRKKAPPLVKGKPIHLR